MTVRRGRPPAVTADQIGRAVLELGLESFTFAAVGERLGIAESTLYRHASDRDALAALALTVLIEDTDWPPTDGPWSEVLERFALAAWHAFEAHPGSAGHAARGIIPAAVMVRFNQVCEVLVRDGFGAEQAVLAADLVFDLVMDNRRGNEQFDRARSAQLWQVDQVRAKVVPDDEMTVRRAMAAAITADPLVWFRAKLEVVLTGISHHLAPTS